MCSAVTTRRRSRSTPHTSSRAPTAECCARSCAATRVPCAVPAATTHTPSSIARSPKCHRPLPARLHAAPGTACPARSYARTSLRTPEVMVASPFPGGLTWEVVLVLLKPAGRSTFQWSGRVSDVEILNFVLKCASRTVRSELVCHRL